MGTINIIKLNYINCSDHSLYKSPSRSPFCLQISKQIFFFEKPIGQASKKLRNKYERYETKEAAKIKKER